MGAKIYNSSLTRELVDGGKIAVSVDGIPSELAEKVVPVMEVNPKLLRLNNIVESTFQATNGSVTLFTTPVDRDFFLTSVSIALVKDVACDLASGAIALSVTLPSGIVKSLIRLPVLALTAQSSELSLSFSQPIPLGKGSPIAISGTFTAGALSRSGSITGFTIDNPLA